MANLQCASVVSEEEIQMIADRVIDEILLRGYRCLSEQEIEEIVNHKLTETILSCKEGVVEG